ncbi:MAG: hypothetical protein HXK09_02775 [Actinomyces bouchesdurhonensis]|jgi:hypothetical protein|uniref:Uncharacterized protein n=1 Tax=Actinomyces bouchesdurhonensis TaxID=1852361 RepID=A0A929WTW8_9ACTO|nr:hypothetical protein [Actinomyces bouchesdurhonensis]
MYFNLIIRTDESEPMIDSRMFEYTDREIKRLFVQDDEPDLNALCELPTIMVKEFGPHAGEQIARIGYVDFPSMCPKINNPILCFPSNLLIEKHILPKDASWGGEHTGWSVIEGDPFKMLFGDGVPDTVGMGSCPIVNEGQVAVMMPFSNDHSVDPVYKAIREGVEAAGKSAKRVDEIMTATKIPDDVKELIRTSSAVVIDLTGLNPNVVYELGFADGLGKKAILIQEGKVSGLPFDFAASRVFAYERNQVGLQDLSEKLKRVIQS